MADLGLAHVDPKFWRGRRVLVTGHTGFKGAWLCALLTELGADVVGFGRGEPPTQPSLFESLELERHIASVPGDVRSDDAVRGAFDGRAAEVVIHMAAQALVRRSYEDPVGTFATNVIGTANVLEAARAEPSVRAVLVVTSDKCYRPRADGRPCAEDAPLGGHDPYSSSKACAELVTSAYREFLGRRRAPAIASARSGNVIGGGDWAPDRLVPDAMRAALAGAALTVRNPASVRPWQHVLNPLTGYLALVERLCSDPGAGGPWNFGPDARDERPVREVADMICSLWGNGFSWRAVEDGGPSETPVLRIDSTKARDRLGWTPPWGLEEGVRATVSWFRRYREGDPAGATREQVRAYLAGGPPPER